MKYFFHPLAEKELLSTISFYNDEKQGLGEKFSFELFAAIDRICKFPFAWAKIDSKTRRCLLNKFPFGILYRVENKSIRIMAVMNLHREPGYWNTRK
jgi:hypothetical protein